MALYLNVRDLYTIASFYDSAHGDPETIKHIESAISSMHFNEDDIDDMILTIDRACQSAVEPAEQCDDNEKMTLLKLRKLSIIHQQARLSANRRTTKGGQS